MAAERREAEWAGPNGPGQPDKPTRPPRDFCQPITYHLSEKQLAMLELDYPGVDFDYRGGHKHDHPMAAIARAVAEEYVVRRTSGNIIDVGGAAVRHATRGRRNVWSLNPSLDAYDDCKDIECSIYDKAAGANATRRCRHTVQEEAALPRPCFVGNAPAGLQPAFNVIAVHAYFDSDGLAGFARLILRSESRRGTWVGYRFTHGVGLLEHGDGQYECFERDEQRWVRMYVHGNSIPYEHPCPWYLNGFSVDGQHFQCVLRQTFGDSDVFDVYPVGHPARGGCMDESMITAIQEANASASGPRMRSLANTASPAYSSVTVHGKPYYIHPTMSTTVDSAYSHEGKLVFVPNEVVESLSTMVAFKTRTPLLLETTNANARRLLADINWPEKYIADCYPFVVACAVTRNAEREAHAIGAICQPQADLMAHHAKLVSDPFRSKPRNFAWLVAVVVALLTLVVTGPWGGAVVAAGLFAWWHAGKPGPRFVRSRGGTWARVWKAQLVQIGGSPPPRRSVTAQRAAIVIGCVACLVYGPLSAASTLCAMLLMVLSSGWIDPAGLGGVVLHAAAEEGLKVLSGPLMPAVELWLNAGYDWCWYVFLGHCALGLMPWPMAFFLHVAWNVWATRRMKLFEAAERYRSDLCFLGAPLLPMDEFCRAYPRHGPCKKQMKAQEHGWVGCKKVQPTVNRSCAHNEYVAARNRVTFPNDPATDVWREATQMIFSSGLIKFEAIQPTDREEWLARFPAPIRHDLKKAWETNDFRLAHAKTKAFIKKENMPMADEHGCCLKWPRMIQGRMAEYLTEIGVFFHAAGLWLKKQGPVFTYSNGMSSEELGDWLLGAERHVRSFGHGVAYVENDYSLYDGTERDGAHGNDKAWCKRLRISRRLYRLLKLQGQTRAGTRHGVKFVHRGRNSGDPNTSFSNTINNITATHRVLCLAADRIGMSRAVMYQTTRCLLLGDDNVIVCLPVLAASLMEIGDAEFNRMGLQAKLVLRKNRDDVEYCSGLFIPVGDRLIWAAKPGRVLCKSFFTVNPSVKYARWLRGVCLGFRRDYNHVPVVRAVVQRGLELTHGVKAWHDKRRREEHNPHARALAEADGATYAFMVRRYGIDLDSIAAEEANILELPLEPMWLAGLYERIVVVDCPMKPTYQWPMMNAATSAIRWAAVFDIPLFSFSSWILPQSLPSRLSLLPQLPQSLPLPHIASQNPRNQTNKMPRTVGVARGVRVDRPRAGRATQRKVMSGVDVVDTFPMSDIDVGELQSRIVLNPLYWPKSTAAIEALKWRKWRLLRAMSVCKDQTGSQINGGLGGVMTNDPDAPLPIFDQNAAADVMVGGGEVASVWDQERATYIVPTVPQLLNVATVGEPRLFSAGYSDVYCTGPVVGGGSAIVELHWEIEFSDARLVDLGFGGAPAQMGPLTITNFTTSSLFTGGNTEAVPEINNKMVQSGLPMYVTDDGWLMFMSAPADALFLFVGIYDATLSAAAFSELNSDTLEILDHATVSETGQAIVTATFKVGVLPVTASNSAVAGVLITGTTTGAGGNGFQWYLIPLPGSNTGSLPLMVARAQAENERSRALRQVSSLERHVLRDRVNHVVERLRDTQTISTVSTTARLIAAVEPPSVPAPTRTLIVKSEPRLSRA